MGGQNQIQQPNITYNENLTVSEEKGGEQILVSKKLERFIQRVDSYQTPLELIEQSLEESGQAGPEGLYYQKSDFAQNL